MEAIWGNHKKGRNKAYQFLDSKYGKDFHFSTTEDLDTLKNAYHTLVARKASWLKEDRRIKDSDTPFMDEGVMAWLEDKHGARLHY